MAKYCKNLPCNYTFFLSLKYVIYYGQVLNEAKEFVLNPKYPNRPAMAFAIWWWFDRKANTIE